MQHTTCSTRR